MSNIILNQEIGLDRHNFNKIASKNTDTEYIIYLGNVLYIWQFLYK